MSWYRIKADGENVISIERLNENFKGHDADGLGVSTFDEDDNETYVDAYEVASYSKDVVIASFDDVKIARVIEALEIGSTVEIMYA